MTEQEALKILKDRNSYAKGFGMAYDMALEALERQLERGLLKNRNSYTEKGGKQEQ